MVAQGEARDAGDLGRVPGGELVRDAHVERGVERHERVEEKIPGRPDAIPPVAREGEESHEGGERGQGAPERRAQGPLPGSGGEDGERHQGDEDREDPGLAQVEACPAGRGAESGPQGQSQRRVDGGPGEALEREPWENDGQGGEGQPGKKSEGIQEKPGDSLHGDEPYGNVSP